MPFHFVNKYFSSLSVEITLQKYKKTENIRVLDTPFIWEGYRLYITSILSSFWYYYLTTEVNPQIEAFYL